MKECIFPLEYHSFFQINEKLRQVVIVRPRNVFFAIIIVLLWASTTVIGRFLVGVTPTISAMQLAWYRYVTGFLTLFLLYRVFKPSKMDFFSSDSSLESKSSFQHYLITGIALGIFPLFLFESVRHTSATAASFLLNSNTVFIAPLSVIFLKERLSRTQLIGISIATIGMFILLIGIDPLENWLTSESFLGNMLAISAGISWALYTIMSKKWFHSEHPLMATLIQLGIASIFLFGTVTFFEKIMIITDTITWLLIFIIGPGATGIGFWLYFTILDEETATTAGSIQYLVPIFSLIYEWVFLNTLISLTALMGGFLTLIGLLLADYWNDQGMNS